MIQGDQFMSVFTLSGLDAAARKPPENIKSEFGSRVSALIVSQHTPFRCQLGSQEP